MTTTTAPDADNTYAVFNLATGRFVGKGLNYDAALALEAKDCDYEARECEGHESLRGDLMGASEFCDGTCQR